MIKIYYQIPVSFEMTYSHLIYFSNELIKKIIW